MWKLLVTNGERVVREANVAVDDLVAVAKNALNLWPPKEGYEIVLFIVKEEKK
jgi:hypothetical protein